jgi:predicted nucleic acid-binding protein
VSFVSIATFLPVQDRARVALLSLHLDPGEAEAIALAVETKADLLLLDERLNALGLKRLACWECSSWRNANDILRRSGQSLIV